jgi:restriction system protein
MSGAPASVESTQSPRGGGHGNPACGVLYDIADLRRAGGGERSSCAVERELVLLRPSARLLSLCHQLSGRLARGHAVCLWRDAAVTRGTRCTCAGRSRSYPRPFKGSSAVIGLPAGAGWPAGLGDWFGTLTGDYRAGAEWWAGQRSLLSPPSCTAAPPSTGAAWSAGCSAAKEQLTPSDVRRKKEPEYRLGWNNPAPVASLPMATEDAGASTAQAQARAPSATQTLVQSENQNPIAPQSSGGGLAIQSSGGAWTIGIVIAFIGGWAILKRYNARKRRNGALRIVADEIDSHAAILHVKRLQTVLPDDYGTVFLDKWEKEKDYYIQTRILPALRAKGLGMIYEALAIRIHLMIEEAAQRPMPPGLDTASRFISDPEIFDPRMQPIDYEKHCALQLEKAGWGTRLTATTGDQGADVIAHRAGKVLVLQCKLYSSPVGNDAVQQVIAARQFQSADLAAVASNQPFTRPAKQLAGVSDVHLLHHEQLASFTG